MTVTCLSGQGAMDEIDPRVRIANEAVQGYDLYLVAEDGTETKLAADAGRYYTSYRVPMEKGAALIHMVAQNADQPGAAFWTRCFASRPFCLGIKKLAYAQCIGQPKCVWERRLFRLFRLHFRCCRTVWGTRGRSLAGFSKGVVVGVVHLRLSVAAQAKQHQLFYYVVDHGKQRHAYDHAHKTPQAAKQQNGKQHPEAGESGGVAQDLGSDHIAVQLLEDKDRTKQTRWL